MSYRQSATSVTGAVLWQRSLVGRPEWTQIMPDGCMDLIWDGGRLFVAGPDRVARWHRNATVENYVGLRFSGGLGPALLGVRADELRDRTPLLVELWSARDARLLAERVEADPAGALQAWMIARVDASGIDPLGTRILAMASVGMTVAQMADRLGTSARQLHRRCLPIFGYGPKHLVRVLRFERARQTIREGLPLAQVAADCGYADQAHLSRETQALAGTTPTRLRGDPYYEGSTANRSTGRPSGSRTTA